MGDLRWTDRPLSERDPAQRVAQHAKFVPRTSKSSVQPTKTKSNTHLKPTILMPPVTQTTPNLPKLGQLKSFALKKDINHIIIGQNLTISAMWGYSYSNLIDPQNFQQKTIILTINDAWINDLSQIFMISTKYGNKLPHHKQSNIKDW